jgi:hypothetical protein
MLMQIAISTYGEENIYKTHHYEDDRGNWVLSTWPNARHVTNIQYLEEENEKKREIKIIQARYMPKLLRDFNAYITSQVN